MAKKKRPFLSDRQQKYKHNRLVIGMRPEAAAVAAGFSRSYAKAKAYRIERSVKIGMYEAFEEAGLTDKTLIEHALKGLNAMKIQACDIYVTQEASGKMKFNDSKDFIEVEDWNSRHKYLETICELSKRISNNPVIDASQHSHLTFVLEKEEHDPKNRISSDEKTKLSLQITD